MLKKKILPLLRKILGYSTDAWTDAYRRDDKDSQYLYDQLYKQVNSVFEFVKEIERYENSKKVKS